MQTFLDNKRKNADGTVQTFVDNKPKQLEKNVSSAQQNRMFRKLAQDELKMKEAMVVSLGESATQTSKAMDKIGQSISSFDKALGDGLAMIGIDGSLSNATSPLNSTSQPNANVQ